MMAARRQPSTSPHCRQTRTPLQQQLLLLLLLQKAWRSMCRMTSSRCLEGLMQWMKMWSLLLLLLVLLVTLMEASLASLALLLLASRVGCRSPQVR
jgi:hypothetical protein